MLTLPTAAIFFFNVTPTTEIYTLSLHDALPIFLAGRAEVAGALPHPRHPDRGPANPGVADGAALQRSEEHTSELQSQFHLVCRLLLEKKKEHKARVVNGNTTLALRYAILKR